VAHPASKASFIIRARMVRSITESEHGKKHCRTFRVSPAYPLERFDREQSKNLVGSTHTLTRDPSSL
jgi:hypothetical protein